eukprot:CAMPEP_0170650292 /NCGR_PEP_ID=MMETSP0224-20130122/45729_1 /TAXON_ID=285029 /ORGANISM="Togula jolla, Strain CCCM 725" /LENGTH=498 /DNA_ID=CAMNT_0010981953 /DNA_START=53 /DNA_END=1549 /DNA_ORIENTATION=-
MASLGGITLVAVVMAAVSRHTDRGAPSGVAAVVSLSEFANATVTATTTPMIMGPTDAACRNTKAGKKQAAAIKKDKLEAILFGFKLFVNVVFEYLVTSDLTLLISLLMILQWHYRHFFPETWLVVKIDELAGGPPRRIWRRLGLNLWILQFYYDPDIPDLFQDFVKKRKFIASLALVVFDNLVIYFGFYLISHAPCLQSDKSEEGHALQKKEDTKPEEGHVRQHLDDPTWPDEDADGDATDDAQSMYTDLTVPFRKVFTVWVIQVMLFFLYIEHLNLDKHTHDICKVQYGFWFLAILIQLFQGDKQLGSPFNFDYWYNLKKEDESRVSGESLRNCQHKLWYFIPLTHKWDWFLRAVMDFSINSTCRYVIMYTFPIMLCVEEPLDFVKDCMAVFFMTTLDDIEQGKSLNEMLIKLKFNALWERVKEHKFEYKRMIEEKDWDWNKIAILTQEEKDYYEKYKEIFEQQAKYKTKDDLSLLQDLLPRESGARTSTSGEQHGP